MIRVDYAQLEERNGLLLYENDAFTGAAFKRSANGDIAGYFIKDGIRGGQYKNDYFPQQVEGYRHIDCHLLNDDIEPVLFQGEPFTGFAYELYKGFCCWEFFYQEGVLISELSWRVNGGLELLNINEDDLLQEYAFHDNGIPKYSRFVYMKSYRGSISFTEEALLNTLHLGERYFSIIKNINHRLRFNFPMGVDDFKSYHLSGDILLRGFDFTDEVFNVLTLCSGFNQIKCIIILSVSISEEYFDRLKDMLNLEYLKVTDKREEIINAVAGLALKRPDVEVYLNS